MKKMALDLGNVRIGIATSDALGIIATGLETYKRVNQKQDFEYIINLIKEHNIDTLVLGLPLNMDGSEGERVQITKKFAEKIKQQTNVKVVYQDERLTSVSAEKILIEGNMRRENRKNVIDKLAATIILQSYLDKS
jgi:putative Holliday junction resolvase